MMSLLDQNTPLPLLPAFDDIATPPTPKRSRGASASLSRRVRANLNTLSIPDISNKNMDGGLHLQLQPQGRATMGGASFESILLGGAMRNKAKKAQLILNASSSSSSALPALHKQQLQLHSRKQPTSMRRTGAGASKPVMMMHKGCPIKAKNDNVSLLSLRMAAMLKGSTDAKAQLKFGGLAQKSFQAPGRARSSPYQPSRNLPVRNRSFNALCA